MTLATPSTYDHDYEPAHRHTSTRKRSASLPKIKASPFPAVEALSSVPAFTIILFAAQERINLAEPRRSSTPRRETPSATPRCGPPASCRLCSVIGNLPSHR